MMKYDPALLLFADQNGDKCDKNSDFQLQFDQLPSFTSKNSKNLMAVIKYVMRKLDQININNMKVLNRALHSVFMHYILMCSSKRIQEYEKEIQPDQEQDFHKFALSFLKHFISFIPKEETLRGFEPNQSSFAILIGLHIEIATKITDLSDDEIVRSTIALLASTEKFFDKRYYTQALLFCNKLIDRPKAAELLYAHIIKLPKAQTVLSDEHFSRIVYLSRNILRVIPKERKESFQSALKLFVPDESITTGVFSEHLPKFNTLRSAMETCLESKNKDRFSTALRRHVINSAKRLKSQQPPSPSTDNLVSTIDPDVAIVEKYIPNIDLCESTDELKDELSWFKYSKSVYNMAKNQKDDKVNIFVSLISDDEDEDMSEDEVCEEAPIPSPEPMEVENVPSPSLSIPSVIEQVKQIMEPPQKTPEPESMDIAEEEPQSTSNEPESLPQVTEKTDREQIAAAEIAETVNTLIGICDNSRSLRESTTAQNEEPPEIVRGSPDSQMIPVMDEIIPIIRNDFSYNSAPVQQIMESVSITHKPVEQEVVQHVVEQVVQKSPEKAPPVLEEMNHDEINQEEMNHEEIVPEEKEPALVNDAFCPINDENVVLHEEIVAFTEEVVSEKTDWTADIQIKVIPQEFENFQPTLNSTSSNTRVHEKGCISLCDKSNGWNFQKETSKTYPSKRRTKAELKSMEIPLTFPDDFGTVDDFGPVLNHRQVKEYSIIEPNIPFLDQRLEHSGSEESIYDGTTFYATLDSEHVAEYVECENGIVSNCMGNSPSPLSSSPPHTGSVDAAGSSSKGGNIKNVVTSTSTQDIKTNDHHHNRRTVVKKSKTPKVTATTTVTTINMSKVNVNQSRKQRSQTVIVTPPQDHCYIKTSTRKRNNQIRKSNSKALPVAIQPKPTPTTAPPPAPPAVAVPVVTPPRPRVIVNNKKQPQIPIPEKVDSPSICISDTEDKEFDNDVQVVEHPVHYIENFHQQPPALAPSPLSSLPIKKRRKLSLYEEDPFPFSMRPKTNQLSYPSQKLYKMYSIADFMEHEEEPPQPQIQSNYLYSPQPPRYSYQRRQKPYYSPTTCPRYHSPEPVVNVAPPVNPQPFIRRSHLPQPLIDEDDFNGVITEEERIHITTLIRCGNYNFTDKVLGNYIMNRRRLQAVDFNLCYNCNDLCGNSSGGTGQGGGVANCQCRNRHYNLRNLRDVNNSTSPVHKVENLKPSPRTMKRSFSTGPGIVTPPRSIDMITNDFRAKPRNYGTTHPKKKPRNFMKAKRLYSYITRFLESRKFRT
ncbi:hypothetical protein ACFFRR_011570 [Megaselia abdita]